MSKTLLQIRTKTRLLIDEIEDVSPVTWQNSELLEYINDGQQFLLSEMMRSNPDYNLTRATRVTAANQNAYLLPADLYGNKFRGIWAYSSSKSGRTEVQYKSNDTIMRYQHINGYPAYYTIVEGAFILSPVPDGVYTLEMWYAARPTELSADIDTCRFKDEEVDAISTFAAIAALERIDRDSTKLQKGLDLLMSEIKANTLPDDNMTIDYDPLDMT
jgi:hypothetical protein